MEQAKAFKLNTVSRKGVGGVPILLGMLDAKETVIGSGHMGLWLVCAFIYTQGRNTK